MRTVGAAPGQAPIEKPRRRSAQAPWEQRQTQSCPSRLFAPRAAGYPYRPAKTALLLLVFHDRNYYRTTDAKIYPNDPHGLLLSAKQIQPDAERDGNYYQLFREKQERFSCATADAVRKTPESVSYWNCGFSLPTLQSSNQYFEQGEFLEKLADDLEQFDALAVQQEEDDTTSPASSSFEESHDNHMTTTSKCTRTDSAKRELQRTEATLDFSGAERENEFEFCSGRTDEGSEEDSIVEQETKKHLVTIMNFGSGYKLYNDDPLSGILRTRKNALVALYVEAHQESLARLKKERDAHVLAAEEEEAVLLRAQDLQEKRSSSSSGRDDIFFSGDFATPETLPKLLYQFDKQLLRRLRRAEEEEEKGDQEVAGWTTSLRHLERMQQNPDFVKIDIDSIDCMVLRALLSRSGDSAANEEDTSAVSLNIRPSVLALEINPDFPPPLRMVRRSLAQDKDSGDKTTREVVQETAAGEDADTSTHDASVGAADTKSSAMKNEEAPPDAAEATPEAVVPATEDDSEVDSDQVLGYKADDFMGCSLSGVLHILKTYGGDEYVLISYTGYDAVFLRKKIALQIAHRIVEKMIKIEEKHLNTTERREEFEKALNYDMHNWNANPEPGKDTPLFVDSVKLHSPVLREFLRPIVRDLWFAAKMRSRGGGGAANTEEFVMQDGNNNNEGPLDTSQWNNAWNLCEFECYRRAATQSPRIDWIRDALFGIMHCNGCKTKFFRGKEHRGRECGKPECRGGELLLTKKSLVEMIMALLHDKSCNS
ncbi:unnamed protein product [Amoebophrya sp. A120]|nr:unnamed protein product [Amoebophrya sp. A120]|eukprot:GSA120T00013461001.1